MFEKTNNIRVCCNIALLKIYKNVIICICLGLNYTFKYIVIPRVKKIRLLLAISLRLDILIICIENSAAVSWRISHVRLCGFCWNISLLASSQNVLKAIEKFVFSFEVFLNRIIIIIIIILILCTININLMRYNPTSKHISWRVICFKFTESHSRWPHPVPSGDVDNILFFSCLLDFFVDVSYAL